MSELENTAQEAGDEDVTELEQEVTEQDDQSEATENTEGQDDDSQPAEGDKPEDTSPSKARRERRKAEMERLRTEAREAQSALEKTNARLARIEEAAKAQQPPKEADFPDYNEYLAATAAYRATAAWDDRERREISEEAEAQKKSLESVTARQQEEAAQNWAAQVEEARGRYGDFESVVNAPDLKITQTMASMIAGSDAGADVAYYLGTHKAEAAKIADMSDLDVAREIGRLEARLSAPPQRSQSKAPAPISPVRPKAMGSKDPDKMSNAEWRAMREKGYTP